jgi:iron complex outermembrane receptor protein
MYAGVATTQTTGYRKDLTSGKTDDEQVESARAKLTWMPTDEFEGTITWSYSNQQEKAVLNENLTPTNEVFAISPMIPQETIDAVVAQQAEQFYTSEVNIPGATQVKVNAMSFSLSWANDDITLESITGYRDETVAEELDNDALPFDIIQQFSDQQSKTTSQEFRVASEEGGAYSMDYKLEWLAGVFLYQDVADRTDLVMLGADSVAGVLAFATFFSPPPYDLGFFVDLETNSWAVFAEVGYYFTDEWHLTVGGRFSRDTKDFTYRAFSDAQPAFVFAEDNFAFDDTLRFESADPKIVMQWEPEFAPDFNAYLSYTQGIEVVGSSLLHDVNQLLEALSIRKF